MCCTSRWATFTSLVIGALVALLFMFTPAFAVHDLDLFELDGNALDDGLVNGDDWNTPPVPTGSAEEFTGILHELPDKTIFTGGRKDIQNIPDWAWKTGSVPDKDDLTNAYAAAYIKNITTGTTKPGPHLILYYGADRFANDGDAQLGFWFFQDNVGPVPDPTTANSGTFSGVHMPGDILVLVEFLQGGVIPNIEIVEWDPNCPKAANNNPQIGECAAQNLRVLFLDEDAACNGGGDPACATTNAGFETAPWSYTPKGGVLGDPFPPQSFFEGGIDLTELLDLDICITSFLAETRSSHSYTATLKDFVAGSFPLCEITVSKRCLEPAIIDPSDGSSILSNYEVKIVNEGIGTVYNVVVKDDNCTPGDTGDDFNLIELASLAPGESNAVTANHQCDSELNPATDTVHATADSSPSGGTPLTSDANAQCEPLSSNPDIDVAKTCETVLDYNVNTGKITVRVDAEITVTNTSTDVALEEVSATDSKISTLTPSLPTPITLLKGESVKFTGSYYPATYDVLKTTGGDPTDPIEVIFQDTANASGRDALTGTLIETDLGVTASCPLCPCPDCE